MLFRIIPCIPGSSSIYKISKMYTSTISLLQTLQHNTWQNWWSLLAKQSQMMMFSLWHSKAISTITFNSLNWVRRIPGRSFLLMPSYLFLALWVDGPGATFFTAVTFFATVGGTGGLQQHEHISQSQAQSQVGHLQSQSQEGTMFDKHSHMPGMVQQPEVSLPQHTQCSTLSISSYRILSCKE